jgi:hypothetical protein
VQANIGVAMGSEESSEVARESANIVLLDDNFASLVAAIMVRALLCGCLLIAPALKRSCQGLFLPENLLCREVNAIE